MEKRAHKAVKMLGKIILLLLLCLGLPILVSSPYDDTHELLSSDGDSHHIKSIPKDADSVEFSYYEI